MKEFHL